MRILMIAPEPFFEPRGTPFSEFHRIRALTELGHAVDLVTYPFGENVTLRGLRLMRCARPPFIRRVKVGPSWAKLALDFLLAIKSARVAFTQRYDAIHSHEEGAAIGVVLSAILGVPHVYDMHSSLPQQLTNFAFSRSRLLAAMFEWLERMVIRHSRVVIVICPELVETVRRIHPEATTVLIENAPGAGDASPSLTSGAVRHQLGVVSDTRLVMYTGTFEAYQGLDLAFEAMKTVQRVVPGARLVLVGGRPDQVERARVAAAGLGVESAVVFLGERPPADIPAYLEAADVLVSPRSRGTNTPLKIYQYLRAGRPIVATRLLTHTQVLSDEVAILTDPTPDAFGQGLIAALTDPVRAQELGERARSLAESKYSYAAYVERTRQACLHAFGSQPAEVAGGVV